MVYKPPSSKYTPPPRAYQEDEPITRSEFRELVREYCRNNPPEPTARVLKTDRKSVLKREGQRRYMVGRKLKAILGEPVPDEGDPTIEAAANAFLARRRRHIR